MYHGGTGANTGMEREVSETVDALGELIASPDNVVDASKPYLIGQLAAELVSSASQPELSDAIVTITDSLQSADQEDASPLRQSFLTMLLGLLNGVQADQQSTGRTAPQLTVREQVLNLLAIEPQNPTSLSAQIGCSSATVSRALARLRDSGLVEPIANAEPADGRNRTYQLTSKGEKRQDDRFFGRLADDEVGISEGDEGDQEVDYAHELTPLPLVVAALKKEAPAIAGDVNSWLDVLVDHVDDPGLLAAAGYHQVNPDVAAADQPHRGMAH
jgi:DNA-binding MarR family transcriptional regulator